MTAGVDWRLGLRAEPREKIFQLASLATCDGVSRAHMLDVSISGVRIHSCSPLAVGMQVVLSWAGQDHVAKVAWSRELKAGLRFKSPLASDQIAQLLIAK